MESTIDTAIKQVAEGTLDFPGYVKLLATAGVHCYTVDLETRKVVYYAGMKSSARKFISEDLNIAPRFNENFLKEAINAVVHKRIDYLEFLRRLAGAGVESYEADFKTKKITYRGRRKSFVEPFQPEKII